MAQDITTPGARLLAALVTEPEKRNINHKSNFNNMTPEQFNRAAEYYSKYPEQIAKKMAIAQANIKPSPEDINNPELWRGSHWAYYAAYIKALNIHIEAGAPEYTKADYLDAYQILGATKAINSINPLKVTPLTLLVEPTLRRIFYAWSPEHFDKIKSLVLILNKAKRQPAKV